ncbi:MAG: SnoaL-like polyketide cyclase [Methanosaeta sp. PtaB.Bin039]|nr:MAG: SnoaL-like polyketide cyclase [Methanosaeta sp. PtaB.Bin039]OPY48206.1 MAG: SnoaL-like polyketide cyclase [Methanosaeta sp. PtaU1.Bin028]HOT07754.1 ester cyclase [Methanotrichaceae archaeon]HQF16976.1 ester cyclase [Methanotrichaceae archaeon]HQI91596.1 ester cyclase [Methanotrichaceae archaeon]
MSIEDNKEIVRRFFELGPSSGNISAARELLAPDFTLHVPLPAAPGVQGICDVITTCRAAFEHLNVDVEDMVAEGDRVAARFTASGIHRGEFMGLDPTGKPITMTGIEIFRISNGKIAELWGEANLMGLMMQLGIIPMP